MRSAVAPDVSIAPVRNLVLSPRGSTYRNIGSAGTGGAATLSSVATGGPDGGSFGRYTQTVAPTSTTTNSYIYFGSPSHFAAVTPGLVHTLVVWVRVSQAATSLVSVVCHTDPTGAGWNGSGSTTTAIAANTWTPITRTFTPPAGNGWARPIVEWSGVTFPAGTTYDFTMCAVVAGNLSLTYADGTVPGWQWTGAADGSESVGYPYTLDSIAGQPAAAVTTPGATVAAGVMGATQGRTLYTVFDSLNAGAPAGATTSPATLGTSVANANGGIYVRYLTSAAANLDSVVRPLPVGTAGSFAQAVNGHAVGRRISALTVTDGITLLTHCVDGAADTSSNTIAANTGLLTTPSLAVDSATVDYVPVAAYAFAAWHNRQTRLRVTAWLARRYGGVIPAGY